MTPTTATKLHGEVQLEHVCSYWTTLAAPEVIQPLAEGLRLNFYVIGEVDIQQLRLSHDIYALR